MCLFRPSGVSNIFSGVSFLLIFAINPCLGSFPFIERRTGVALRPCTLTLGAFAGVLNNGTLGRGGAGGGEGRPFGECNDDADAPADGVTVDGSSTASDGGDPSAVGAGKDDTSADGVKVVGASTAVGGGGPPAAGDDEDDASADVVGCGEDGAGDDAF